jgi:hypothetical protein
MDLTDVNRYTNMIYPFPIDPPHVPYDANETGSYLRTFTVPKEFKKDQLRLRFEGVDSSFHVWVNGKEVGYSQGSRNPSEFDITPYADLDGENTLAVQVYQFCDGSYIEDQVSFSLYPKLCRLTHLRINGGSVVFSEMSTSSLSQKSTSKTSLSKQFSTQSTKMQHSP